MLNRNIDNYLFTSESVSEGHPDKLADRISDSILDLMLTKDKNSRSAVETMVTTDLVLLCGEISCREKILKEEIDALVREQIKDVGYHQEGFDWRTVKIENYLHAQSTDIAMGVDNDGAGDQGIMFGYAIKENFEGNVSTSYMPSAIYLSHKILRELSKTRKQEGDNSILLPDGKSQVTLKYENGKPVGAQSIVVSHQHRVDVSQKEIKDHIREHILKVLPKGWMCDESEFYVNPTGRFVIGGPNGDTGLTGRKIIVDTYGGYAPHGGGAFSGKDATKVDRSAAYAARYLAKNIVAAELADECLIQLSYAIGVAKPLSIYVDCNGTSKIKESKIAKILPELMDLSPKGIISHLQLKNPIYTQTSAYGHFGRKPNDLNCFTWEQLDLVDKIKDIF